MVDRRASFHVDLGALQGTLQAGVQTAIQRVSFGLLAGREMRAIGEPDLPDAQLQFRLGKPQSIEDQKADHENWTLGNGLRDCAEALNTFLDRSQEVCVLYSFGPNARIPAEQWNRLVIEDRKRFQLLGLARKLDWLRKEYDLEIVADAGNDLLTVNAARNCLVHRNGIVQQADQNSDAGLTVRWTKPQLQVEGASGSRPMVIGKIVEAGERIMFTQKQTSKNFRIGDRVQFDSEEFSELCWTFVVFGIQIVAAVEDFGKSKGFKFRKPGANGESA